MWSAFLLYVTLLHACAALDGCTPDRFMDLGDDSRDGGLGDQAYQRPYPRTDMHHMLSGLDVNLLRHHGGEAVVGLACGTVASWLVRKVQSTIATTSILLALGTAAALHLGWTSPMQVRISHPAGTNRTYAIDVSTVTCICR